MRSTVYSSSVSDSLSVNKFISEKDFLLAHRSVVISQVGGQPTGRWSTDTYIDFCRYINEDIMVHEFAHAVHQFGGNYAIPRFQERLENLYNNAVNIQGKYANKYMGRNPNEYFVRLNL